MPNKRYNNQVPGFKEGGKVLKPVKPNQKGLKKLPKKVRNKMGYMKKGGRVKKKKQGYKDRKDESIAMRVKKKRTKKQLRASANESYGKFGSKARKKGKINK